MTVGEGERNGLIWAITGNFYQVLDSFLRAMFDSSGAPKCFSQNPKP